LSQFSRRARWLNQLFTASRAPQSQDPNSVSDDVSLVQPYDGSGWGIMDPGQTIVNVQSPLGAVGLTQISAVGRRTIARLLGVGVFHAAGALPTDVKLYLLGQDNNFSVAIGRLYDKPMLTTPMRNPMQFQSPMMPPGTILQGHHTGGDAATLVQYTALIMQAPVGTVFYV